MPLTSSCIFSHTLQCCPCGACSLKYYPPQSKNIMFTVVRKKRASFYLTVRNSLANLNRFSQKFELSFQSWTNVARNHSKIAGTRSWNEMLSCQRETALQNALVWPKVEDWNWRTIFFGHYRSIFNYHCNIIGLQSYRIRLKNTI